MEVVVFAATLLALLMLKQSEIADAIENFRNIFRGGPPPTHPLPANDAPLLRRRR